MIKRIRLQNFQSHKDTQLELSPGVNAIIGPSDSGKTAVLRGLLWNILNVPTGDAFRSSWGGDTEVSVTFDNRGVVRRKTKTKNQYLSNAQAFDKIGRGVPSEIENAINMDPDVNIREQHQSHFLLPNTPAERARLLNKAAKLDQIDEAVLLINSKQREIASTLKEKTNKLRETEEELRSFETLDELDATLSIAEAKDKKRHEAFKNIRKIKKNLDEAIEIQNKYERVKLLTQLPLDDIMVVAKDWRDTLTEKTTINHSIVSLKELEGKVLHLKQLASSDIQKILARERTLLQVKKQVETLQDEIQLVKDTTEKIRTLQKVGKMAEERYHELMPDICPLCGQKIEG